MKRARVVVLAIAFTAALGAAWVAKKIVSGPREGETVEKTVGATDVLVSATDINLGDSVRGDDLKWQQWPVEGVTPGLITRNARPDAPTALSGAVARAPHLRRGGAAQGARARHWPGNREQGRRESGHWQDRDARAYPAASGGSRSGAVDGRDLALLAQP